MTTLASHAPKSQNAQHGNAPNTVIEKESSYFLHSIDHSLYFFLFCVFLGRLTPPLTTAYDLDFTIPLPLTTLTRLSTGPDG